MNSHSHINSNINSNIHVNSNNNSNNNNNNKIKLIFLFGNNLSNISMFSKGLKEAGLYNGIRSEIINHPPSYECNDIINKIKSEIPNKKDILIISITKQISILEFITKITQAIENFYDIYEILNICYCMTYKYFFVNENKNIFSGIHNIVNENLINYIFIDDSDITSDKVENLNKLTSIMNTKAKFFNKRSFIHSEKEICKIYENITDYQNILNFYSSFKSSKSLKASDLFIKLMYLLDRSKFEEYLGTCFNIALLSKSTKKINSSSLTGEDYEKQMIDKVLSYKARCNEPVIESITGYVSFKDDLDRDKRRIYHVKAFYKDYSIIECAENIQPQDVGLIFIGINLKENIDYFKELVIKLSGELPQLNVYRDKSTITQKEIENLNQINLFRDVPEGWYLDTPIFVDPNEKRHNFHPSILY